MKLRVVRRSSPLGFTLVELLVASTILTILLVAVVFIIGSTQQVIGVQRARLDAQKAANEFFAQIGRDLQSRIAVPEAQFFWGKSHGNDEVAFFTQRPGYVGDRKISWVAYRVNGPQVERGASGLTYNGTTVVRTTRPVDPFDLSTFPSISTADYQLLTRQILRLEISALVADENGTLKLEAEPPRDANNIVKIPSVLSQNTNGGSELRGILVTVVALDSRDLALIDGQRREAIANRFADAADGLPPASAWTAVANDSAALAAVTSAPLAVVQNLRVYERLYPIRP